MGYKSLQINISPIRWNTLKIWLNTLQTMVWYIWIFLKLHLKQFFKMSLWHWHKYPAQCYILVKRIHTFINLFLFDYLKTESRTYTVRTNDTYMAVKLNYFFFGVRLYRMTYLSFNRCFYSLHTINFNLFIHIVIDYSLCLHLNHISIKVSSILKISLFFVYFIYNILLTVSSLQI